MRADLYPELEREEFHVFVRRLVGESGYALQEGSRHSIRVGDRVSQPSYALLERLFLFDLWSRGVCYGSFKTSDPRKMAEVIGTFVVGRASIDELEHRFPWLRIGERARAHEGGRLVDYEWRTYLERSQRGDPLDKAIGSLLRACATRPRLRALLPFTSVGRLMFSHTTGYPFESMATFALPATREVPGATTWVERIDPDRFRVMRRGHDDDSETALGEGDAEWAATTLEQAVPDGWGPARDGTEGDGGIGDVPDESYNAIFAAVAHEDSTALRAAILAGVDVNEADLRPYVGNLNTPLHHAASLGNAELVRILLEAGAHVDARCAAGWTALGLACNAGALEAAKLLVDAGADLEATNGEGYTPTDRIPGTATELLAYMRARLRERR